MAEKLKYADFTGHAQPCRIKPGWEGAERRGLYLGKVLLLQWWAIVVWDDEEDPETFKAAGIEIRGHSWESI